MARVNGAFGSDLPSTSVTSITSFDAETLGFSIVAASMLYELVKTIKPSYETETVHVPF
jgi:hypothetical protein